MPRFFRRVPACLILLALLLAGTPCRAGAQFLQTDLSTYQLPDPSQEVAVIVTPKGIFVSHSPRRSSTLSGFDPEQLTAANSTSLFLAYAPDTNVPERLILSGAGNRFRIRGTFTVILGSRVRVAVALNTNGLPYVTIVSAAKGQEAILGFVGQQPVVNLSGQEAVELLEADPLRRQFGKIASPYVIASDNKLYLLERLVPPGSSLGLLSPPDNPCLNEGAKFLWDEPDEKAPDTPDTKKKKNAPPLSSFLTLNISPSVMVGIHFDSGRFVAITQQGGEESKICLVRPLQLKKSKPPQP